MKEKEASPALTHWRSPPPFSNLQPRCVPRTEQKGTTVTLWTKALTAALPTPGLNTTHLPDTKRVCYRSLLATQQWEVGAEGAGWKSQAQGNT